ncbi:MAG: HAD family hydrolase [Thermoanaerobaculia bacterium]
MHLQGIIFDIDGTLVDSNEAHIDCWIEAFQSFHKTFDRATIGSQMGKGGDLLVPDLLNAREMRSFGEDLQKSRGKLYKEKYLRAIKPFPAIRSLFQSLRAEGLKLALASSSDAEEVKYYTGLLEVGDLLEGSTSKKDARFSKPSPEIFAAALEQLGTDDARTIAVGDTPYDILAAHRVPLPVIAVRSGGFEDELLKKAEFLFDDVAEMGREIDRIDEYFRND